MKKHYLLFIIALSIGYFYTQSVNAQIFFGNNPDAIVVLNELYTQQVVIQSSSPDAPTYTLPLARPGMEINPTTGLISWTPSSLADGGKVVVLATNTGFSKTDTILFYVTGSPQCDPSTVAYWKLDEGSGDFQDSYGNHDADRIGTVSDSAGIVDRAAGFAYTDGDGISVPYHADFDIAAGSSFSVSFWFKTPTQDYPQFAPPLMMSRDQIVGDAQWWIGIQDNSSGALEWYLENDATTQYLKIESGKYSVDTWHHLVCLYDATSNNLKMYLDGDNTSTGSDIRTATRIVPDPFNFYGDGNLAIGCMLTGDLTPIFPFNGLIDEVLFFDKALNQSEIDNLFVKGSTHKSVCALGNAGPIFISDPVDSINEDSPYSYTAVAKDLDVGDVLTYTDSIPGWMSFNATTHVLSGTPTNTEVGVYPVTLRVSDGSVTVRQKFNLTVVNVNDTPVIESSPVLIVNEEQAYSYDVDATDVDASDVITYSLTQNPIWLSINSTTGVISGTAPLNDTGSYAITVRATDVALAFDEQSFTLDIRNVNDAPVITGQNPNPLTVDEDNPLAISLSDIVYTDVDNASGDITLTVLSGTNYTFTGNTITPAANYNGSLTVNIQVSDLLASASGTVAVSVNPVNDAPVITSTPVIAVNEDEPYVYNISFSDVDAGDVVTLSYVTLPGWMDLNVAQATLTGAPTNDQVGMDPSASFAVKLKVSDGTLDSTQTFNVTVTNINDAPEIIGQKDTLQASPNSSVPLQLSNIDVTDVDDQVTDLTLTVLAGSNYTVAGNTVIVNNDASLGYLPVNIRVSDPGNAQDEGVYQLKILLTGIEDMQYTSSLVNNVYPSPASEYVVFECAPANQLILQIFDITGNVLIEEILRNNASKLQINTTGLHSGIYIYKVYSNNNYQVGRFVISNN